MNRRQLFKSLGAVMLAPAAAVAPVKRLIPQPTHDEIGAMYARHLARSMLETKETLTANIINNLYSTTRHPFLQHRGTAYG